MSRTSRRWKGGFTLVELMIVVAIIGILAAIAIPAFSRYVKKSRTAEAAAHLNKMWAGSIAYYETDHMTQAAGGAVATAKQFPFGGGTAGDPGGGTECGCQTGGRCPVAAAATVFSTDAVWLALSFSLSAPFNYKPGYAGSGTGTSAVFTATATGDLDCDATVSTFTRVGGVSSSGDVTGANQPTVTNELE